MLPLSTHAVLCPVLVGRAPNVQALQERLEQARTHMAQVLLLTGEAGVGKTRLVAEAKTLAAAHGFAILQGQCFEPDRALPYAPLIDLLRTFCLNRSSKEVASAFGPTLTTQAQAVAPLLNLAPELAEHFPNVEPAPALEPEQEKRRLFGAFTHWLTYSVGRAALLVVMEDVHWADEASLELLLHLIRRLAARPVVFLLTFRPTEGTPALTNFLAELDRTRLAEEFPLAPLSLAETEMMMRAIFGQAQPIHTEFASRVHELTDGNPFFVEEVLKALVSAGDIYVGATGWVRKPVNELRIPRTVQDAVTRRATQLSEPAQQLLALAAVAGRQFDFQLLQTLTGQAEAQLITHIKELIAAQLVVEESAEVFAFRHTLTRQAVYTSLLARERRTQHFRVAEALEPLATSAPDGRVGELAYHFFEAEAWGKALAYAQRAGERAQKLYAPRSAVEHFSRALTAAQKLAAPKPLSNLFRARGQAYETLGEFELARADYEAELAHAQGAQAECQAQLDLAALWAARDYARMGEYLEQALRAARQVQDAALLARTLNRAGNWHMNMEHAEEALAYHAEAQKLFEQLGEVRGLAETYDLLAMATSMSGDPPTGMTHYERAEALWRQLNDQAGLAGTLAVLGPRANIYFVNVAAWPLASAEQRLRETETALRLSQEIQARPSEVLATAWLAQVTASIGEYGRALTLAAQAVTLAEGIGHQQFMAVAHWVQGALYLDLLAAPPAITHLEAALKFAQASQAIHWVRTAAGWLAAAHIQNQQLAPAEAVLSATLTPTTPKRFLGQRHAWAALAELRLRQNRVAEAVEILEQLEASAPPNAHREKTVVPRLNLLMGEGRLALGQAAEAEQAWRSAVQAAQTHATISLEWRARAALARLYRAQKREAEAEAEIAAGLHLIQTSAATLTDEGARANFLHHAQQSFPALSPRQTAKKSFGGLTARERQVAVRVANGQTNKAIAEALVVSERTVEKHIENILHKLGVESRVQIAAWVIERGLG